MKGWNGEERRRRPEIPRQESLAKFLNRGRRSEDEKMSRRRLGQRAAGETQKETRPETQPTDMAVEDAAMPLGLELTDAERREVLETMHRLRAFSLYAGTAAAEKVSTRITLNEGESILLYVKVLKSALYKAVDEAGKAKLEAEIRKNDAKRFRSALDMACDMLRERNAQLNHAAEALAEGAPLALVPDPADAPVVPEGPEEKRVARPVVVVVPPKAPAADPPEVPQKPVDELTPMRMTMLGFCDYD